MKKKETLTVEFEHCGECSWAFDFPERDVEGYRCDNSKHLRVRIIKDLWGEIPDWCPLETVEEE